MKRILIVCGALSLPAVVGVSTLRDADEGGAAGTLMEQQDTSVIVRRVYEGRLPEFWANGPSPDGRYVTQTDWDTGDLSVLDLLTGQMRRVTGKGEGGWETSSAFSETSRFSPDGQRIAYSWFTEPGTYELRVIDVDGTNDRMVARAGFEWEDPPPSYLSFFEWWPDLHGWSPDGQHILATLYYGQRQELTLLSVADGSREVLSVKERPDAFAVISPEGRYLAYGEKEDVFVQPLRGGDAVAVASGPSKDALLGWTEQGSLLYLSDRDLTEGVWRVPMRNGRPAGEAVLVAGDLWGMQRMGVAGNSLFYGIQSEARRLHVVPLDLTRNRISGPPTPIEPQIRESSYPAWSPDGERLLYWVWRRAPGSEPRLMLRSAAGRESRDATPASLEPVRDELRWSRDGRRILISGKERGSGREGFFAYTLATGDVEFVFSSDIDDLEGMRIFQETFSSDWESVYLPVREGAEGSYALIRRDLATGDQRTLLTRGTRSQPDQPHPFRRVFPSPDDRFLAFWEYPESGTARMLRVVPAEGGNPRTLLTEPWSADEELPACVGRHIPLWTSDDRYLVTVLRDSVSVQQPLPPNPCKVYKVSVDGGDPTYLGAIPPGGPPSPWALSPDNSRLVFQTGEDRGEIWILQGLEGR